MQHYKYLIVGGGMTGDSAIRGIREVDPEGSIGLITAETYPPYDRPPLSKGLWKGKPLEKIFRSTENKEVDIHLATFIKHLDAENKRLQDDQGKEYTYDKLLLATGGTPQRLPFGKDQILYFRTLDDYKYLRSIADGSHRFAVIGSGFIGSEVAAALKMNNQDVIMLFPDEGIGGSMFPPDLSHFLNEYYREKGIEVLTNTIVSGVESQGRRLVLNVKSGQQVEVDHIVAGIGILPNTELARSAGLKVKGGIFVDQFLRSSYPDIFAAGDVASFYNPALAKRLRFEHEDNANNMGKLAGGNMARTMMGTDLLSYDHLPFFYSDLFELGYEAIGELSPQMQIESDWKEPYKQGIVYYLDSGRVRGVLAWNTWGQMEAARGLIGETGPFTLEKLKERLPV
jgi:3-phenylpropionate/trans-cinnamate dioxygenase ferredoxin reductase subunit